MFMGSRLRGCARADRCHRMLHVTGMGLYSGSVCCVGASFRPLSVPPEASILFLRVEAVVGETDKLL